LSQLGLIEFHQGNHARAAQLFREALEIDPDDTVALYNLARLSIMEGKRAEGNRLIERFRRVKQRPMDRPMGGMGEPVVVPGKYAQLRDLGEVEAGS
jgi:tetratricopeptide (TPR) repeat protein